MNWAQKRRLIAAEIVRRIDTVTLATVEEVADIYMRASQGEFDYFDLE